MNCTDARARLPGLLYGDLSADEAGAVRKHLAGCAGCRQEQAALEGVRRLLDQAPTPPAVQVDLPRLYAAAAAHRRGARRWRRGLVVAGVAAAALLAVLLRMEVRVDAGQLVLRWGAPPETQPAPLLPRPEAPPAPAVTAADLKFLKDLLLAQADDALANDERVRQALVDLQARLDDQERVALERWEATQRLVSALHTVQLETLTKGGK
jgi:hypothetical protein